MSTLVLDTYKYWYVAIFCVPGAYLNAYMPDEKYVELKLEGEIIDVMCDVNPSHIQNIWYKNGKTVIYLIIIKSLYKCIDTDLLWYNLYVNTLKLLSFVINTYDRCVANKTIDGRQCQICCYIDDNNMSHANPKVNTIIIKAIAFVLVIK